MNGQRPLRNFPRYSTRHMAIRHLRVVVRASSASNPGLVHLGPLILSPVDPGDRTLQALGFLDQPPFELSCAQDRAAMLGVACRRWRANAEDPGRRIASNSRAQETPHVTTKRTAVARKVAAQCRYDITPTMICNRHSHRALCMS